MLSDQPCRVKRGVRRKLYQQEKLLYTRATILYPLFFRSYPMSEVSSSNTGKILGVGAAVVVVGALAISALRKPEPQAPPNQQPITEPTPSPVATAYKDGTYTADGAYRSPAGEESISTSITLENGVITASTFTGRAVNPVSTRLQKAFSEGFTSEVVGKRIDEVELTVVNGSSLTPKGFMDALAKIQAEARS